MVVERRSGHGSRLTSIVMRLENERSHRTSDALRARCNQTERMEMSALVIIVSRTPMVARELCLRLKEAKSPISSEEIVSVNSMLDAGAHLSGHQQLLIVNLRDDPGSPNLGALQQMKQDNVKVVGFGIPEELGYGYDYRINSNESCAFSHLAGVVSGFLMFKP